MTRSATPRRWTACIASAALITSAFAGLEADAPAVAATPTSAQAADAASEQTAATDVVFYAGAGNSSEQWKYGASQPVARRLTIAANTTRLTITLPFPMTGHLQCYFRVISGPNQTSGGSYTTWTTAQWAATDEHVIEVPVGVVQTGAYRLVQLGCDMRKAGRTSTAAWTMRENGPAPDTVELNNDPAKFVAKSERAERRNAPADPNRAIIPGDRVVVRAQPGAWPTAAEGAAITGTLRAYDPDIGTIAPTIPMDDVFVSDDGSQIGGTIPTDLSEEYQAVDLAVNLSSSSGVAITDTTPAQSRRATTAMTIRVQPPTVIESATRMELLRPIVTSNISSRIAVRVTASGVVPSGTVRVRIDGSLTARFVPLREDGTVIITLPKLYAADHTVQAEYSGIPGINGSASSVETIHVPF